MDWKPVAQAVEQAEHLGTVGVAVIGSDGQRWSHNGDQQFRAASTVKIPLMVEVYRRVDAGTAALDATQPLGPEDKAPGSGVLLHLHDGLPVSLNDLIYLMISISDNSATNMLIRLCGMDAVNATMRELDMVSSNLGREMKGRPAVEGEQENWATANDYVTVTQAILDGRAASAASCAAMVAMLEKQQNTRRISRYLPEGVRWGSKTGSIKGVTNDVGFIETERGRLIIAVFCDGMADQHIGEEVIGNISRAAMQATGIVTPLWTS